MKRHALIRPLEATSHRLAERVQYEIQDLDLDQAQVHVLSLLRTASPMTVGAVHALFGHRPSTVTAVLDRLEQRGLVERRPNPLDRRSTIIELTSAGSDAAARIDRVVAEIEDQLAPVVGPAALANLVASLEDLELLL